MDFFQIGRGSISGVFLRAVGMRFRSIALTEDGVILNAGTPRKIPFSDIACPLRLMRAYGFSGISIKLADGSDSEIVGLNRDEAKIFINAANESWRRAVTEILNSATEELQALTETIKRLEKPRRYPAACLLAPFLTRADALIDRLTRTVVEGVGSITQREMFDKVSDFQKSSEKARATAVKKFSQTELEEQNIFFDSIESNPLTPEQRLAVVTDEDATLILAGAGSGKTSVIVAKAAYLIQRNIRQPKEILLMAYGKGAAEEMAARIEERAGAAVNASTFHALGYDIIRQVEGQAPALAAHASDEAQFRVLLCEILMNDLSTRPEYSALLLRWFSEFYRPYRSEWDFKTKDAYFQYVEAQELRTLRGELVRSFEELQIANWLYLNGIAYEYEPVYEHHIEDNVRRAYTPDFRLTDSGAYIEHFGVRKAIERDGNTRLETAPFVNRERYLEDMEWKRTIHKEYETTLIETFSYEQVEGCLLEALKNKVAPYVELNPRSPETIFDTLAELGQVDTFTQTLGTFLRHFKSGGLTFEYCSQRAEQSEDKPRSRAFLKIFKPVLEAYQRRLGERIDFEDMIVRATEHVRAGRFNSPYRHLLVDEFQDISEGRASLLRALKAQHADARIFAVGDDWQSIYRFAGADIHLMRNFGKEFGGNFGGSSEVHSVIDLGRTFRSVDKITIPARSFILKNPSQIEKTVIPASTTDDPAIQVAYYSRKEELISLMSIVERIASEATGPEKSTALLLGRYRFVRPKNLSMLNSQYSNLSLSYKTVHASKGLEADHVIIMGACSGKMGFPNEIVDDPILDMALPEPEQFDHAEERRLFYVALTRARKSVTILAAKENPSVFVRELVGNAEYGVPQYREPDTKEYRCSSCEGRMLAQSSSSGRVSFSCEHTFLCGNTLRACGECGHDLPVKTRPNAEKLVCRCGAQFSTCPDCTEGWLVARKGRYGEFLGCINFPSCRRSKQIPNKGERKSRRD